MEIAANMHGGDMGENPEIYRQLGEHGARLASLETASQEMGADVKEILATLNQAKGGWRILIALSTIAGAFGGYVTKILHMKFGGG